MKKEKIPKSEKWISIVFGFIGFANAFFIVYIFGIESWWSLLAMLFILSGLKELRYLK